MATTTKNKPIAAEAREQGRRFEDAAYSLRSGYTVELARDDKEEASGGFRMRALTGKPFFHPFWGNLAVDLSSLKLRRRGKIPTLREHIRDRVVGFTSSISVEEKSGIEIEGQFSQVTRDGKEVFELSKEGYPWEASVSVPPGRLEFVERGSEVEVNGHKLKGPGTVFRDSTLVEVSFVSLGADPGTRVSTFSVDDMDPEEALHTFTSPGGDTMPKTEKDTGTAPATEEPKVTEASFTQADLDKAKTEAAQAAIEEDRKRCAEIRSHAFSGQEELVQKAIDEGWSVEKAALAFIDAEKKSRGKELGKFQRDDLPDTGSSAAPNEDGGSGFDPDKAEFDADRFGKFWDEEANNELKREFYGDKAAFLAHYKYAGNGKVKA